MLELPFKIVIPSHHRPEAILKNPVYSTAHIVVNDDAQVDEYREAAAKANITPGEFVVCGPQPSIAAVRNFIVREVWDASEPFVDTDGRRLPWPPADHALAHLFGLQPHGRGGSILGDLHLQQ